MDGFICCPAIPEEGDGDEDCEEDHVRKAHFRFVDLVVLLGQLDDDPVACRADEEAREKPKAEGEVSQACDLRCPMICVRIDCGDCGDEEIEEAVDQGHVSREDGDYRRE